MPDVLLLDPHARPAVLIEVADQTPRLLLGGVQTPRRTRHWHPGRRCRSKY